ncbi:MAG: hypothetical protein WD335_00360 [Candidatus Paceibacterota bacterium]
MEIPIDKILQKYTLSAPDRTVHKKVIETIKVVVGVDVPLEAVMYQNGRIHVDTSPLLRSQIHIHKEEILKLLKEKLEGKKIKDVR